ncbi:MAG TPA: sugar transferase, partial [Verrucomicrobiae bacterium]|nr:sugar transferase [Verrucomicrobiae bacterium]
MLRRNRQIKMQIFQVLDAILFGLSFWLAWFLRSNPDIIDLFNLKPVHSFDAYFWLYLLLIIGGPLVLEAQGFYDRPLLSPRRQIIWPLFKGCLVTTVALIMVLFFFRVELARGVAVLLGGISFVLIYIKEELVRSGLRSKFALAQLQRKYILVGT